MQELSSLPLIELLKRLQGYQFVQLGAVPQALCREILYKIDSSLTFIGLSDIAGESFIFKAKASASNFVAIKIALPSLFSGVGKKDRVDWAFLNPFRGKDIVDDNTMRTRFIEGCKIHAQLYKLLQENKSKDFLIPRLFCVKQDPCLYCVMEWIEGIKIIRWLKEKKSLIYSLTCFIKLLECVKFFHDYQIIHRDIKSDNMLIARGETTNDCIVLLDWTISKLLDRDLTCVGTAMGTLPYASPKILAHEDSKNASYPDDIFALGLVLFEFVHMEKLSKPVGLDIREERDLQFFLDKLTNLLPLSLQKIFQKATAIDEAKRYQVVTEFLDDIAEKTEEIKKTQEYMDLPETKKTVVWGQWITNQKFKKVIIYLMQGLEEMQ